MMFLLTWRKRGEVCLPQISPPTSSLEDPVPCSSILLIAFEEGSTPFLSGRQKHG